MRKVKFSNLDDCAGTPVLQGCVRAAQPAEFEQWSQELQLVFPRSGSFDGLIGAYYSDADAALAFSQLLPLVNAQPLSDFHSTSAEPAAALFGQAAFQLAEGWSATAGVRLSWEEHRVSTIGTGIQDSPTLLVVEKNSDDLSWRLDLTHEVTDDVLILPAYPPGTRAGASSRHPSSTESPTASAQST